MERVQAAPVENVYLVAEHRLLRETLVRLLKKRPDISVVGEARHTTCSSDEIMNSTCGVLLLDSLTAPCAMQLLDELYERAPQIRIVLFGMDEDSDLFLKAVRLGVSGYICKEASAAEIVGSIRAVARGEAVCPPRLCMELFHHSSSEFRKQPIMADREARLKFGLTHRQSQLVGLVAKGLTNKEIAVSLNVSEFTVKNHMRRIMKQVRAESRYEAVDLICGAGHGVQ